MTFSEVIIVLEKLFIAQESQEVLYGNHCLRPQGHTLWFFVYDCTKKQKRSYHANSNSPSHPGCH